MRLARGWLGQKGGEKGGVISRWAGGHGRRRVVRREALIILALLNVLLVLLANVAAQLPLQHL